MKRHGFTLIELLVVIAIIGVLMALTTAAVSRVMYSSMRTTSEEIVRRVGTLAEQAAQRVVDNGRDEPLQPTFVQQVGDPQLARQMWVGYKLKQQFPLTYAEARSPCSYLPGDPTYVHALASAGNGTGNQWQDSPALLYLAVAAKNRRGGEAIGSLVAEHAQPDQFGLIRIVDAWGTPLALYRNINYGTNPPQINTPMLIVVSAGPNQSFGSFSFDAQGNLTSSDVNANDNIYSHFVGR